MWCAWSNRKERRIPTVLVQHGAGGKYKHSQGTEESAWPRKHPGSGGAGDIREVGPKDVTPRLRLGVEMMKTEEKLGKVQSLEPVGHV